MSSLRSLGTITSRAQLEAAMQEHPTAILKRSVILVAMRNSGANNRFYYSLTNRETLDYVRVDGRVAQAHMRRAGK